jgi:hypothetical protein
MNILEAEDMVKGLPDQALFQIAQNPPPHIPQFLAISEVQRRQDMRQRYQAQTQGQEPTVKDQILQGGIAAVGGPPPGTGQPPPMAPMGAAPPGAPMQQPMTGAPMGMSRGGQIPGGPGTFRQFIQRNFMDPRGLTQNAAALAGALSPVPGGAGIAGRLAQRVIDDYFPAPYTPMTDFERVGMTGIPFSEAGRGGGGGLSEVTVTGRRLPMPMGSKQATVTVEEIPEEEGMYRGGLTPGGIVQMQAGRAVPDLMSELQAARAAGDFAKVAQIEAALSSAQNAPPAAPNASEYDARLNQMLESVPRIMSALPAGAPSSSFSMADLQKFAPTAFDSSQYDARREESFKQLGDIGRQRKAEDIAAAERYRAEAEAPIKSAQEEARKTAIASTLMRLGAGLASGNPAQGLASASESVENIMTRAREQAASERRAIKQEFRQAEREASRGERGMEDIVFQMRAQQITSDESKQRELVRDQKQFALTAFNMMREQGKEARQAYRDSLGLSVSISQAIDKAIIDEAREKRISQNQYMSTSGSVYRDVLAIIDKDRQVTDPKTGEIRDMTNDEIIDLARKKTQDALRDLGVVAPGSDSVLKVGDVRSGYRYKGGDPSKETSWEKT